MLNPPAQTLSLPIDDFLATMLFGPKLYRIMLNVLKNSPHAGYFF